VGSGMTMRAILKRPSAFLPLGMSAAALALVLGYLALHGVQPATPGSDEGAAAHLWQLLMGAQLPIIAFFALTSLPRAPRPAFAVLLLQALAICAAAAPILILEM